MRVWVPLRGQEQGRVLEQVLGQAQVLELERTPVRELEPAPVQALE